MGRIAMTEACREWLREHAETDSELLYDWLDSVEILPEAQSAPAVGEAEAEALDALEANRSLEWLVRRLRECREAWRGFDGAHVSWHEIRVRAALRSTAPRVTEEQVRAAWAALRAVAFNVGEREDWLDIVLYSPSYAAEHGEIDEALRAIAAALPPDPDAGGER